MPNEDRKDKIEQVHSSANKIYGDDKEAANAWRMLCHGLEDMTHPEAPMPRFNGLLKTIQRAAILNGNTNAKPLPR